MRWPSAASLRCSSLRMPYSIWNSYSSSLRPALWASSWAMAIRRGSWDPIIGYPSPSISVFRIRTYALSISCFCW